jgi:hypothetical protein
MTDARRHIALIATVALALAACGGGGGGGTSTGVPDGGSATAAPALAATSAAPTVEVPPTAAAGPTQPSSGGGTAKGVCELVTVEELAEIFGVASVTTTVFAGPPDTCSVDSDTGDPLVAWSYSVTQSTVVFQALASDPSAVEVDGIGDQAAIVENTGLLVLKGDSLIVVAVQSGEVEIAKEVGAAAAGRM